MNVKELGVWPDKWIHGGPGEPSIQTHRIYDGVYVFRQSKHIHFEGNFVYLIIGTETAILFDTGASDTDTRLVECVMEILNTVSLSPSSKRIPLIVAHTHSHGDHIAGDALFVTYEDVTIVPHGYDNVKTFFNLTSNVDTNDKNIDINNNLVVGNIYDIGDRPLEIFFILGHYTDHIAIYDPSSKCLLTGDFLVRGRLYVQNRKEFVNSTRILDMFVKTHPVSVVLGSHIEMCCHKGMDYPDGCQYQPDEPSLALLPCHVEELCRVVGAADEADPSSWGPIVCDDFIVVPVSSNRIASATKTCIALIREVFYQSIDGQTPQERLIILLQKARDRGATLSVLPELPMDEWYPRHTQANSHEICGSLSDTRIVTMATCAQEVGINLIGGVIIRASSLPEEYTDGVESTEFELSKPRNVTMIFDSNGSLIGTHVKRHLPREPGFWEEKHFAAGTGFPTVKRGIIPGLGLAVQTCSDIMRAASTHVLTSLGAGVIFNPRATEGSSSAKWKTILCGLAATTGSYIISVPRPSPEGDLDLGGEAFCISPQGESCVSCSHSVLLICEIDTLAVGRARVSYPNYLNLCASEYAIGWQQVVKQNADYDRVF